ncbi:gliding motility protein [Myxococcus eversor]|uniref:gliding motility protein n=1 Tax=Myxococcus eversor TaxID=2709661 RepID=UPI0013D1FFB9|nr:gliding motility protein [Myxococcus eversor]
MSESWEQRARREAREMEAAIQSAFARRQSDLELRAELESLAQRPRFRSFPWLWGPALNARDRVLFRPLILSWLMPANVTTSGKLFDPWKSEYTAALETWLNDADRADDVAVFRKLYSWKLQGLGKKQEPVWREDVARRFRGAKTRSARHLELSKVEQLHLRLDEATALALDAVDPEAARPFIRQHLPFPGTTWSRPKKPVPMWSTYRERLFARGDMEQAWTVYRRLVSDEAWREDALALTQSIQEPEALVRALDEHHPEFAPTVAAHVFVELVERRGRDVVPYVLEHLRSVFPRWAGLGSINGVKNAKALPELLELCRVRGWEDVWSAALRTSATEETFDTEVRKLVKDADRDEQVARRRLLQVAGAGAEWNLPGLGFARVLPLTDATAVAMYERFPELVRGPFRMHVASGWHAAYPELVARVLERRDEELLDFIASRAATQPVPEHGANKRQKEWTRVLEALATHYEELPKEGGVFARRAANALGAVPAFSIWDFDGLLSRNRLARLFFQRSDDFYLADPLAVRDLLEAPQIHVQALAFRLLGRDSARASALAILNLDLLQATLLRPLHRRTRLAAFGALANAALNHEDTARVLLPRMREAFALPDKRYPKEALVELLAKVLTRWPELRGPSEVPRVFSATTKEAAP